MTGLFHRLAQQVVGPTASRAHAAARLPFAAPPTLTEPIPMADTIRPDLHEYGGFKSGRVMPDRRDDVAGRPGADPNASPARLFHGSEGGDSGAMTPAGSSAAGNWAGPADGDRRRSDPPITQGTQPTPGLRRQRTSAESMVPGVPALLQVPPPLLPERDQPEPRAPAPAAPGTRHAPVAGPPEVHVHIGRIEVSSVSDPPPAQEPAPRRREPTMSLDDYLGRRGSRR